MSSEESKHAEAVKWLDDDDDTLQRRLRPRGTARVNSLETLGGLKDRGHVTVTAFITVLLLLLLGLWTHTYILNILRRLLHTVRALGHSQRPLLDSHHRTQRRLGCLTSDHHGNGVVNKSRT